MNVLLSRSKAELKGSDHLSGFVPLPDLRESDIYILRVKYRPRKIEDIHDGWIESETHHHQNKKTAAIQPLKFCWQLKKE